MKNIIFFLTTFCLLISIQGCGNLFYHPDNHIYVTPDKLKLDWKELTLNTEDGETLNAWFFPSKLSAPPKGLIVQFHGNAQNLSSHFVSLVWLTEYGYDFLAFDYRGYGKSTGKAHREGLHKDGLAVLKKALEIKNERKAQKLIVYGQSLGGNASVSAIHFSPVKNQIDLLVQDSTFSSYQDIAFDKIFSIWWLIPFSPLAYVLVNDKFSSEKYLNELAIPTIVVHGTEDNVVPYKFGERIFNELPENLRYKLDIPKGKHIDAYFRDQNIHRKSFVNMMEQVLVINNKGKN